MIREIKRNDFDVWIQLRHKLWPMHTIDELKDDCNKLFEDDSQKCWLYFHEDETIGFIEMSIKDKAVDCKGKKIGYVEGWYVCPAFQQKGIGLELYMIAENWAIARGCTEMASDTRQDYPHSRRAHEAAGFNVVRRSIHFKKTIS